MNLKMLLFASVSLVVFASCQSSDDDPYMTLETKTLAVEAEGGLFTVDLASNVYYRVNNDCQAEGSDNHWAVIDSYETQGEITKFSIKVSENSSTAPRVGAIRFIGDDVTPLKLAINQKMIVPKGINPTTESIKAVTTEAVFKVFGDKEWRATCSDTDVTISPESGVGECDVKLTFPENKKFSKRTIKVKVTIVDDKDYEYTLVQNAFLGILADWDLNSITASTSETFADSEAQSVFPGANGKYVAPSTGNGKIEYWAGDRTGYVKQTAVCNRAVGGNGDPYISGAIPGDYWYVYGNMKGEVIPAGTKIHFYFVTKLGTMCSSYWMIEFKDGEEWKPALPTSTIQESATETVTGATIDYSATVTYNFAGLLLDTSNNGAYIPAEGTFTTTKDMEEIVLRFGQAGRLCLNGAKFSGKYIDCTHASGQTRFSAQHPSNPDTGAAVKLYNQHVLLEIVE